MKDQINVLLIEDNPVDARLIRELLSEASDFSFNVTKASTLAQGIEMLASRDVDVILLDLGLPDSQGLATVRAIFQRAPHYPVIMLTVLDDEELAIKAVREGAQDYLTKDTLLKEEMTTVALTRSIAYAIERKHTEEQLRQARDELEQRVTERTQSLAELNAALRKEIGERKKVEEQLRKSSEEITGYSERLEQLVDERTAQLKDAERMATIGQTAAMVGHDLRNPLQALQLLLDLQMQREQELANQKAIPRTYVEQTGDVCARMHQQIQYMDKIVSDLYDFSRPLTLKSESVNLRALAIDTLSGIVLPKGVDARVDIPNKATAYADEYALQRVLTNIILNAVQAMPEGGTLHISATSANDKTRIRISDTGAGIPDEVKATLFAPLVTHKAKGVGLGLAVSKRLMEAQSGSIDVESEVGHGSTFTLALPATPSGLK